MPVYQLLILALIQGITEFLPISSSGHLILAHHFMGGEGESWAEDLTMDIAVHVGTLLAVLIYFRRDIFGMIGGLRRGGSPAERQKTKFLIVASLPVIAAGYGLHVLQPDWARSLELMAWASIIFGIALWIADRYFPTDRRVEDMCLRDAVWVGLAQALALIPGVSRSGITMTAGRALGFSRVEAARFSLLLAVVAISGAGVLGGIDLYQSGDLRLGVDAVVAAFLSFISAWLVVALMMRWLENFTFTPFVLYRVALGVVLLALYYGGYLS